MAARPGYQDLCMPCAQSELVVNYHAIHAGELRAGRTCVLAGRGHVQSVLGRKKLHMRQVLKLRLFHVIVTSLDLGAGVGGVGLGALTPVFVLIFNTLGWSFPAYAYFRLNGERLAHHLSIMVLPASVRESVCACGLCMHPLLPGAL